MRQTGSFWMFLLTVFLGVATSIAILPGCGGTKSVECGDSENCSDSSSYDTDEFDSGSSR